MHIASLEAHTTLNTNNLWKLALRAHLNFDSRTRDRTQNFLITAPHYNYWTKGKLDEGVCNKNIKNINFDMPGYISRYQIRKVNKTVCGMVYPIRYKFRYDLCTDDEYSACATIELINKQQ